MNNILVQHVDQSFHIIRGELERWRELLAVPYQDYLLGRGDQGLTLYCDEIIYD